MKFFALLTKRSMPPYPPNFLIVMADDCTYNDLPVYGGQNARTPNIDQLATQGLTFNRAYLSEAMCQPCRAELFSGQYPMRNGCAWNHSASRLTTGSPRNRFRARCTNTRSWPSRLPVISAISR